MAGAEHLIVVADAERPWSLLFEIADVAISEPAESCGFDASRLPSAPFHIPPSPQRKILVKLGFSWWFTAVFGLLKRTDFGNLVFGDPETKPR